MHFWILKALKYVLLGTRGFLAENEYFSKYSMCLSCLQLFAVITTGAITYFMYLDC